jgi:hypothetical protein
MVALVVDDVFGVVVKLFDSGTWWQLLLLFKYAKKSR